MIFNSKIKKDFYEGAYNKKNKRKFKNFLGQFYLLFKSFEKYREDIVYDLLPKGNKFLDLGCGEGNLVFKALKKFDFVYGVDIVKTRLEIANEKRKKLPKKERQRVDFRLQDADKNLPFPDFSFDAVTLVASLEHFFDPFFVINEVKRVLKLKGIIIIQVPNLGFLPRRLEVLFGNLPVTSECSLGWDGGHLHYFTAKSLKNFLKGFNFSIEKVTCSGVFASFRSWWTSFLGGDIIIIAKKN